MTPRFSFQKKVTMTQNGLKNLIHIGTEYGNETAAKKKFSVKMKTSIMRCFLFTRKTDTLVRFKEGIF